MYSVFDLTKCYDPATADETYGGELLGQFDSYDEARSCIMQDRPRYWEICVGEATIEQCVPAYTGIGSGFDNHYAAGYAYACGYND